jgi:arylsulfatase A-like enzyme
MPNDHPNIVLIDAHDLGTVLGCYGWRRVDSPSIDRLASEGALFTEHFATAPICIPSRAGLYAGVHPSAAGCYGQDAYDQGTVCIAARLREHGYRTYLSGWNVPNPPEWAGYQQRLPYRPDSERTGGFFREHATSPDGPFFVHFSFSLVHRPFLDTFSQYVAQTLKVPLYLPDTEIVRYDLACLYYKVGRLDRAVGRILEAIREGDLQENTIVVFTTDHGPAIARAKHTLYDPGIRTALILRYPGVVQPGMRYDALLSNVDLVPTLLGMAGLEVPPDVYGRSFLGLISEESYQPRTVVYAAQTWGRRSGLWHHTPTRCIRTARYKLIRNYTETPPYVDTDWLGRFGADRSAVEKRYGAPAPRCELYDLEADPWELGNLAGEPAYAGLCAELEGHLTAHLEATEDAIVRGSVPNKEGKPDVPLWEQQGDGSYRLRAYHRDEGSDVPFGEPLRELWASRDRQ